MPLPPGGLIQLKFPLPTALLWHPYPEQAGRRSSPGGQVGRKVPSETPQVSRLPFFPDQLGGRGGRGGGGVQRSCRNSNPVSSILELSNQRDKVRRNVLVNTTLTVPGFENTAAPLKSGLEMGHLPVLFSS